MNVKQKIIEYSNEIGIDAIGFCKAEPNLNHLYNYQERKDKGYACKFEYFDDMALKVQPEHWLKDAKTFIVILESYSLDAKSDPTKKLSAKISKAAVTEDYHVIVHRKLELLSQFLKNNFFCKTRAFCDNQGFSDRYIAQKAGLGNIGKSSFLINEKYGTSTFIGYLLTDLDINEDQPLQIDYCGSCTKCIDVCPGQAILSNKQINANACISYLTQSKTLTETDKRIMSNNLYGCDICQLACPYNKNKKNRKLPNIVDEFLDIETLLNIDNKTFKETLKKTASGWKGKKHLQRNAIIALGNKPSHESVQLLNSLYSDKRKEIRMEIVHSLGRIGSSEANEALTFHYLEEKDIEIKQLIKKYLK